ncbi:MAG TPA: hypothetical protein PKB10_12420, partial [Tepidisphaeraceae bacterium]|nr:hypothetical protein [Tepidisphaeraceae bacterium]
LRGEAMLDVIFNGSTARKPSGMAEVTLVFENPVRADNSRLLNLDFDEVSVGRRLYRDGTSEYVINGTTSRLKDVRDLFLDTGVGVDAYSVIEQGRVAQMLESSSTERRLIFEEAAGISRFKVKKKEAQRKVEKRLRSVKIQAGKARNYQELTGRLNELRLGYSLQEYHVLHQQVSTLEKQQEETRFDLDDAAGDLQSSQNALAERRQSFDAISEARQRIEYEIVQTTSQIEHVRQRQHHASQQLQQLSEQMASLAHDREIASHRLTETQTQLRDESASLEKLTADLETRRADIDARQQAFRDAQLKLNELSQQIERDKSRILDTMRKLSGVQSRLASMEIERKNLAQQQQRVAERRRAVVEQAAIAGAMNAAILADPVKSAEAATYVAERLDTIAEETER